MLALNPIHQGPYKPPFYSVKFANGNILEYGEQAPAVIKKKSGTVTLDLKGFLDKRIAGRIKGDTDKTANNLEYQLGRHWVGVRLFQAVSVSKDEAIGIIGYPIGDKGGADQAHDLVSISVRNTPDIRLIRTLPIPYDGIGSNKHRLFWSKHQLLLREQKGFDIIDATGRKTGELSNPVQGQYMGQNSQGCLIYARSSQTSLGIELFDIRKRQTRSFPLKLRQGYLMYSTADFFYGKVNFHIVVTDQPRGHYKPGSVQTKYLCSMNAVTGKVLRYQKKNLECRFFSFSLASRLML